MNNINTSVSTEAQVVEKEIRNYFYLNSTNFFRNKKKSKGLEISYSGKTMFNCITIGRRRDQNYKQLNLAKRVEVENQKKNFIKLDISSKHTSIKFRQALQFTSNPTKTRLQS